MPRITTAAALRALADKILEMVKNAGLGIVTANGNPYMKDNADVVVADNNSDGVYEAFEKYILS